MVQLKKFLRPVGDEEILLLAGRLCGTLKDLEIDGNQLSNECVAVIGQCSQLCKLNIHKAFEIRDNGVSHLSRLHNLNVLQLSLANKVSSHGWVHLFSKSRWGQMKKLSLSFCHYVNDKTLQQVANTCPNLAELDLSYCHNFSYVGLMSVLQNCTDLEDLDIMNTQESIYKSFYCIPLYTRKLKKLRYEFDSEEGNSVLMHLKKTIPELQINGR